MLPEEQGRFCLKCTKSVVDFSGKNKDEIKSFFQEATGKVCGRFSSDQLEKPETGFFHLPQKRLGRFAAAIYLVFGALLFSSCRESSHTLGKTSVEYVKGDVLPEEIKGEVEVPDSMDISPDFRVDLTKD